MGEGLLELVAAQPYECFAGICIGIHITSNTYANIGLQVSARSLSHRLSYLNAFLLMCIDNCSIHAASHLGLIAAS